MGHKKCPEKVKGSPSCFLELIGKRFTWFWINSKKYFIVSENDFRILMKNKMLRLENVKSKTGLSRSTIYRLMDEGRFPHQINLGYRAVAWLESEVDNWLDEKISSSRS